ncbi:MULTISPECIES: hypothetical protein [Listeria]|uniref:hypothetical protein n=1 Tax=Listeria TaxID=1637 RepID=UPI000B5873B7|nr:MULTISPECIES: hypothetical protein [Listeria]
MKKIAVVTIDVTKVKAAGGKEVAFTVQNEATEQWAEAHQEFDVNLIRIPWYVKTGDALVNFFVRKVLKIKDVPEYENMLQFVYFSHMSAFYLSNAEFDEIVFENHDLLVKTLPQCENEARYREISTVME